MQTFLPYKSFKKCAKCLDNKRLGKQRVESAQILKCLRLLSKRENVAWSHHPAVLMWQGYEIALGCYHDEMIREWIRRGFKNTMPFIFPFEMSVTNPHWINNILIQSHRSRLLQKDNEFYKKYNWNVKNDLPYYWPCRWNKNGRVVRNVTSSEYKDSLNDSITRK